MEPAPGHYHARAKRPALLIAWIVTILLVVVAGGLAFAYWQTRGELSRLKDPATAASFEAARLVSSVGAHMKLPNEKPTIATVEDTSKLKGQAFFKHAQNGDKVLMYTEHKKAILYRPSADKIMEVAYLNIQQQTNPKNTD